jgi:catechol 2,3-dioxygenase-like lactoylglutathione lyase family enzyme
MVRPSRIYHSGIPANDLDRARAFYTEVLGLEWIERLGGPSSRSQNVNRPEGWRPTYLDRFRCGDDELVIFERPWPRERAAYREDGITHQAFEVPIERFDEALATIRAQANFDQVIERTSGKTIYFFDPEGNYVELHFTDSKGAESGDR